MTPATPSPTGIIVTSNSDLLTTLLVASVAALIALGCLAVAIGWIVTGCMLRPLHDITAAARRAGTGELEHRIARTGPQDELKDISDSFDVMLTRLERAFQAHRRFAAKASYELRTQLATPQAVLDVALEDPAGQDMRALALKLRASAARAWTWSTDCSTSQTSTTAPYAPRASPCRTSCIGASLVSMEADAAVGHVNLMLDDNRAVAVQADPPLLRQLILNLLQKAVWRRDRRY